MTWDSVPWFVGNGAAHAPEVQRSFAYLAMSGAEGVGESGDLKVTATSTPGSTVQIAQGVAAIVSRSPSNPQEMYVGRNRDVDTVAIAATGSGGGRTDMVVALVKDPNLSGSPWPQPADPTVGPYITTAVLSNVPSTATTPQQISTYAGYTAIPLARITIPANTATITNAMITDLRYVARPRKLRTISQFSVLNVNYKLSNSSFVPFPSTSVGSIYIPGWATLVHAAAQLVGVYVQTGAVAGNLRLRIGDGATQVATRATYYNEQQSDASRHTYNIADDVAIPSALRGTTQNLYVDGQRSGGSGTLAITTDAQVFYDLEFTEAAA